jgi:aminodeoxyfutalosine deaminase
MIEGEMTILHSLPKVELHLHLEGSIEPATLREIDPSADLGVYRFSGFDGFIECFKSITASLRTPEDYAFTTKRLLARLEAQNVRYAEITLSAGVILWRNQNFAPIFDAVRRAATESAVEVRWILDAVRHFGADHAMRVAELAAERVRDGVVAFGIGGDEARGPASWFGGVFDFARRAGLHLTAHAGETCGPESVRAALEIGAERIGHGIRAIDDPALPRELAERDIPLEVCVSSNVATGAVASLEAHPLRRLYDAGVPIVLSSDDPGVFGTTLTREYEIARDRFGFSENELRGLAENSFRYAFRVS